MPQPLAEMQEPVNALWYGEGGTGKTTALAGMAHLGKILVINAESGVKAKPLKQLGIPIENIEIYPGPGEVIDFDGLEAQWLRLRELLNKEPGAYAGVVWDSITEIHKTLLDVAVAKAVAKADRLGKERDAHFVALEDYGTMTEQVRALVRKFRDLPCHFGMSALARREQDDDGKVTYQPSVTPKLQADLIGWVDVVCVTSMVYVDGEEEYRGLFRPEGKFRGKDRFKSLPKHLVTPSFDRVVQYVNDELTLDKDPVMKQAKARFDRAQAKEAKEAAAA